MTVLTGRRVLIVEDEYILARQLERALEREGAAIVGAAPSVAKALALLEAAERVDIAILDVNLAGEKVHAVAEELRRRAVPFVVASGYEPGEADGVFEGMPHVAKPLTIAALLEAMARVPAGV